MSLLADHLQRKNDNDREKARLAILKNPKPVPQEKPIKPRPMQRPQLAEEAFHGVAGEIVRMIDPHIEGDIAGTLITFLVMFGNAAGRNPFLQVGADDHRANNFAVLVGRTSKGRKGSTWNAPKRFMGEIEPEWVKNCILSGLSSGEGLIYAVRDPAPDQEPIRDKHTKDITGYREVVKDPGVSDKRCCVYESEFASVLRVADRDGNTLSTVIRQAWDTGEFRVASKNSPIRATDAHVSFIAHITPEELRSRMRDSDAANGFANRFLWFYVERSKLLPRGGELNGVDFTEQQHKVRRALDFARRSGRLRMDEQAAEQWDVVYAQLGECQPGLLDKVTSRAEPHVLRIALIYALLDESPVVRLPHLDAALAVWKCSHESAELIFGGGTGDSVADAIIGALRSAGPAGMSRTDISTKTFRNNRPAEDINRALQILTELGMASSQRVSVTGTNKPKEVWFASGRES